MKGGGTVKITLPSPLRADDIARYAGGQLFLLSGDTPPTITHICTDSREADCATMLCAIRGERVDGHQFLPGAAQNGCRVFLCERLPDEWSETSADRPNSLAVIVVPDTVAALAALAAARRDIELRDLCVVAITGSVGKTTTKEMIAAVLAAGCAANGQSLFKKDGNYNSVIGLPLSFWEIPPSTECAVLEMGMSARGEIAAMTGAVCPDIALVTNVGSSHLEHLGTRENIARAKLEIAEGLREGGTLLLNGDEPLLAHLGRDFDGDIPHIPAGIRVLRISLNGTAVPPADFHIQHITPTDDGMRFDLMTPDGMLTDLHVPAMGTHMVWAAAFAAAVGYLRGQTVTAIRAGLSAYRTAALRQNTRTVGNVTFIEDCYNAAPESMAAALGVLDLTAASHRGRRVAVLGDMRELGGDSAALHRAVGEDVARRGVDFLLTVGDLGALIADGAVAAGMNPASILRTATGNRSPADTYPATAEMLADYLQPGDTVLWKASRAMTLEELSKALVDRLTV